MSQTFLWHDYESSGVDPMRDRPMQFAAIRTDLNFKPIGEPITLYSRLAEDVLPQPEACLVTGITPQLCDQEGLPEAEFIRQIHSLMMQPGTCSLGYNSLRFDDELTRFTLYRNFFDAYEREWKGGNSRWDLIDLVRATYLLRPDGINWPLREGSGELALPSFRLEDLTAANGIAHEGAHDALVDVRATIALARLIREKQPKLYDYLFNLRDKREVWRLIDLKHFKPLLHVSGRFAARQGCAALVMPLALHPRNRNAVIAYDLMQDPSDLIDFPADQLSQRLFAPAQQLGEGVERPALKNIHANRCPVLVSAKLTEDASVTAKAGLNLDLCRAHYKQLKEAISAGGLLEKVVELMGQEPPEGSEDPDLMLYSGGFFSDQDRNLMQQVRDTPAPLLSELSLPFSDLRLNEMLFRYRARNYPQYLNETDYERWNNWRCTQLMGAGGEASSIGFDDYAKKIQTRLEDPQTLPRDRNILEDLLLYAESIYPA